MTALAAFPESFIRRVSVRPDGCWMWSSAGSDGYGTYVADSGVTWRSHRFAYTHGVGPIPGGLVIDHLCRVARCVNPMHLEAVTQRENSLRGVGAAAQNAAKTHCNSGHPFDESNTRWYTSAYGPYRACRVCEKRRRSERAERDRNGRRRNKPVAA